MQDNRHDEFDDLIDGALATYSAAEPLAGLEDRILRRVTADVTPRRAAPLRWWLAAAIPALAALVALAVLLRSGPQPQPPPNRETARVATPARKLPEPAPPAAPAQRRPALPKPAPPLPKLRQFPAPSPITAEDRALLLVAQSYPDELLKQPVERIEIPPIEIAPLQIDGIR
jgi:hypothetical protein